MTSRGARTPASPSSSVVHSDTTSDNSADDSSITQESSWRLMHPILLVSEIVDGLKSIVSLMVGIGIIVLNRPQWRFWCFVALGVLLLTNVVVMPLLTYFTQSFRLSNGAIQFRCGIINRKRKVIGLSHVHAISKEQPLYFQPFHAIKLSVASAGDSNAEIVLSAVDESFQAELEQYRSSRCNADTALDRHGAAEAEADGRPDGTVVAVQPSLDQPLLSQPFQPNADIPVYRAHLRDIVVFAVTNLGLLGTLLAMLGLMDRLNEMVNGHILADVEHRIMQFIQTSIFAFSLLAIVVILAAVAFSVVTTLFKFYDFQVSLRGDDVVIQRGLLTRHTVVVPMQRIQNVSIHRNVLRSVLKLSSVTVALSAAHGSDDDGDSGSIDLIPVIRDRELYAVISHILPKWHIAQPRLKHTARGLLRYMLLIPLEITALLCLALIGIAVFTQHMWMLWLVLPSVLLGGLWCVFRLMKSRCEGYEILDDEHIVIGGASGFTMFTLFTKRSRIQTVDRYTTPLRMRADVEKLIMPLFAFGKDTRIRLSALKTTQAEQLAHWATHTNSR
ncbi:PH domain-containing protein [Bifidobacterium aquikefiri]|uniref:PH domain-containing protein n=1 Tax=Bifidobacterium aquikefiri TaxID=1653207 RepID=UPI0023EF5836|nr:PH domain-containing protein [Bifidobacterium aquikefiri]